MTWIGTGHRDGVGYIFLLLLLVHYHARVLQVGVQALDDEAGVQALDDEDAAFRFAEGQLPPLRIFA